MIETTGFKKGGPRMNAATAIFRNGRLELTSPVDWPEGISVEVKPVSSPRPSWRSLPPLDVGSFREVTGDDDLLEEMLDDSRN